MSRMSVNLSPEMEALVEATAKRERISKNEVIRRAFALFNLAETEKGRGRFLAVVKENEKEEDEIVGRILGL